MSFFFPHTADNILSATDRGLAAYDDSPANVDLQHAALLLGDNFAALEDYTANQTFALLTGTFDGAGNLTLAHGITSAFGLLSAQAWQKGASAAQSLPATVTAVDATNVTLTGGANKPVRVVLVYSIIPPQW